jgi:predicted DNA-binding transcriptional regulator AlpA
MRKKQRDENTLSANIAGEAKAPPPPRAETFAQIVAKHEANRPPLPQGQDDHQWPASRGPPRLWRLPQVLAFTGLKKTQLYDAIARRMFPKPIKILASGHSVAWLEDEIVGHVRSRIVARDQSPSPAA